MSVITYLSRKEPKEQIGVVLFVHREETGITRNVVREWPTADSRQPAGFLYIPIFNIRSKKEFGTQVICQCRRKALEIVVSEQMRRCNQFSGSRGRAPR